MTRNLPCNFLSYLCIVTTLLIARISKISQYKTYQLNIIWKTDQIVSGNNFECQALHRARIGLCIIAKLNSTSTSTHPPWLVVTSFNFNSKFNSNFNYNF